MKEVLPEYSIIKNYLEKLESGQIDDEEDSYEDNYYESEPYK